MKKLYLFLFAALLSFQANAQTINIPDANLKNELLDYVPSIDINNDNEIQVSEALTVTQLFITSANISDLTGIQSFTNLTFLNVVGNNLTTVDLTGLVNLTGFNADYNQLTSINLGNADNLQTFSINNNNISSLDLTGKTINWFSCTGNNMTQLILTGAQIQELHCENNALTAIDLSFMSSLQELYCFSNQITELNFANLPMLHRVECQANPIQSLDFSRNPILFEINVYNPQLQFLSLKNGGASTIYMSFLGDFNDVLTVCTDENDIEYWRDYFLMFDNEDVFVTSYCTFIPGGTYNTISGSIKHDLASDGCGEAEPLMPHYKINIAGGASSGAVYTTANGTYDIYSYEGTYTITPEINYNYFTLIPGEAQIVFPDSDTNFAPQDFCMVRNGIHKDVEIVILPDIPARPGFDSTYLLSFHNKGTETMSGTITFQYSENLMDYVSASQALINQSPGLLEFGYSELQPFETRTITVTLNSNTPMETPPVNIGMQLDFMAIIYPLEEDETPFDNDHGIKQEVVGSFDPNDIACLEGETIAPEMVGEFLHYLIRFQNTGTFYAENVVVTDVIDPLKYDIDSFQLINTSHQGVTKITGDKVEFIFEGINLPAEQDDESGSNGFVAFRIKSRDNLIIGNSVSQYADIFFDFNFPITTNVATTTVTLLNTSDFELADLNVSPNPVKDELTLTANQLIKTVELYDLRGRLLNRMEGQDNSLVMNMSNQSRGIYLLKVQGETGNQTVKVIKD